MDTRIILCIQVLMYKKLTSFVVSSTFKYTDFFTGTRKKVIFLPRTQKIFILSMRPFKIERRSCKLKAHIRIHFHYQNNFDPNIKPLVT